MSFHRRFNRNMRGVAYNHSGGDLVARVDVWTTR